MMEVLGDSSAGPSVAASQLQGGLPDDLLFKLMLEGGGPEKPRPLPAPLADMAERFNAALAVECPDASPWVAKPVDDATKFIARSLAPRGEGQSPALIVCAAEAGLQSVAALDETGAGWLIQQLLGSDAEAMKSDLSPMERAAVLAFLPLAFPGFATPGPGFDLDCQSFAAALLRPADAAQGDDGIMLLANRRTTSGLDESKAKSAATAGLRAALEQGGIDTLRRIEAAPSTIGLLASLRPGSVISLGRSSELSADIIAGGRKVAKFPFDGPGVSALPAVTVDE
jgi:hypothetical protein